MPMWRCPHCGTPQPETARCWVCRRSSTTCSTCRHFRRSLAASVGFCGLDRRRTPLHGTEHRGCWEVVDPAPPDEATPPQQVGDPNVTAVARLRPGRSPRPGVIEGFVPVELAGRGPRELGPIDAVTTPPPAIIEAVESWADRETLFGEREA